MAGSKKVRNTNEGIDMVVSKQQTRTGDYLFVTALKFVFLPVFFLAGSLVCFSCNPKNTKIRSVEQPERFVEYSSQQVQDEIVRLERILADSTTVSGPEATTKIDRIAVSEDLFCLLLHRRNLEPDYDKALMYARNLFDAVPSKKLYYASWGGLLRQHVQLLHEKDSLQIIVQGNTTDQTTKCSGLQSLNRKQSKQIDSLSAVIRQQNETMMKLRQLDINMEKQRSKIQ